MVSIFGPRVNSIMRGPSLLMLHLGNDVVMVSRVRLAVCTAVHTRARQVLLERSSHDAEQDTVSAALRQITVAVYAHIRLLSDACSSAVDVCVAQEPSAISHQTLTPGSQPMYKSRTNREFSSICTP